MKREAYQEQIAQVPLDKLVFLDECGFSLALYRLYGWVIGGGRCVETVPFHLQPGKAHSVMGALSLPTPDCPSGLPQRIAPADCAHCGKKPERGIGRASRRSCNEAFLQDGLLPVLQAGSVLVLDNARFHHGGNIASLVEAAGCSLLYLPPYSPDFNPIERLWSWLKARVRALAPRFSPARGNPTLGRHPQHR